jgi:hypothetical protein
MTVCQRRDIALAGRNLITELRHWRFAPGGGPGEGGQEIWVYKTNYWYDEAGNRGLLFKTKTSF